MPNSRVLSEKIAEHLAQLTLIPASKITEVAEKIHNNQLTSADWEHYMLLDTTQDVMYQAGSAKESVIV